MWTNFLQLPVLHAIAKAGVLAERSCTPALAGDHTGYMRAVGSTVVQKRRRRPLKTTTTKNAVDFLGPHFFDRHISKTARSIWMNFFPASRGGGHTVSEKV